MEVLVTYSSAAIPQDQFRGPAFVAYTNSLAWDRSPDRTCIQTLLENTCRGTYYVGNHGDTLEARILLYWTLASLFALIVHVSIG